MDEKVRTVNFSPDEFLVGVAGMKPMLGHVYWVTCALQMSSGKPINVNDPRLFSIIDARRPDIAAALDRLVSLGKLLRDGDEVWNERTQKEIESATKRIQNARKNGPNGGRPRKENNDLENQVGSVVGSETENLSRPLSRSLSQSPSKEGDAHTSSAGKGTRLGKDWRPDQQDYLYGAQHGLSGGDVDAEGAEFRDYFLGADAKRPIKRDWRAAFHRWLRENAPRRIAQRSTGRQSQRNRQGPGSVIAAVGQVLAARKANQDGMGSAAGASEIQRGPECAADLGGGRGDGETLGGGVVIQGEWRGVRDPSDAPQVPHAAKG